MEKENLEEYMELFYKLDRDGETIRTKKIAEALKTTKGNVSQALTKLKKEKLITYEPYQEIKITNKGRGIGKKILNNHETVEKFLINCLNISVKQAHKEACKIEHAVSEDTVNKLHKFMERTK